MEERAKCRVGPPRASFELELIKPQLQESQTGIGILPEEVLESPCEQCDALIRQSTIETDYDRCQLISDIREGLFAFSANQHDILGRANDFRGCGIGGTSSHRR
jgi:hypothetical protein